MKIIRASHCLTTPWKNGGGSTTEIAAEPSGTSLDTFDWRVSMAQVASDGPFSEFPGIDRTLAIVSGRGLVLTIGNDAPVTIEGESEPINFAGDIPTSARLIGGEITDLNVMARRGRFSHRLRRVREALSCDYDDNDTAVVLSLNGNTTVTSQYEVATLGHGDAAILVCAREVSFCITPAVGSDCYLVLLRQHRD